MEGLASSRCFHHELREAVSRCPSCGHFFCRECVVVFEDRLICNACLPQVAQSEEIQGRTSSGFGGVVIVAAGLFLVWFLFYAAGWLLLEFREKAPLT